MLMEELEEKFEELADEFNFKKGTIKRWYKVLLEYPCINEANIITCLETLCQRREDSRVDGEYYNESLKNSIEFALYNTCVDDCLPYVSKKMQYYHAGHELGFDDEFTQRGLDEGEFDIMEKEDFISDLDAPKGDFPSHQNDYAGSGIYPNIYAVKKSRK